MRWYTIYVYNGIGLLRRCDSGLVTTEESRSQWAGTASSLVRESRQQGRTHNTFISYLQLQLILLLLASGRAASPSGLFIFPFVPPTGPGDELLSGTAHGSLLTLQVQHFLGDSNILLTSNLHPQPPPSTQSYQASGPRDISGLLKDTFSWEKN